MTSVINVPIENTEVILEGYHDFFLFTLIPVFFIKWIQSSKTRTKYENRIISYARFILVLLFCALCIFDHFFFSSDFLLVVVLFYSIFSRCALFLWCNLLLVIIVDLNWDFKYFFALYFARFLRFRGFFVIHVLGNNDLKLAERKFQRNLQRKKSENCQFNIYC